MNPQDIASILEFKFDYWNIHSTNSTLYWVNFEDECDLWAFIQLCDEA